MTNTNPPLERETTNDDANRNTRRLTELLMIAEQTFARHERLRQFGREIEQALRSEAEDEDEGRSRRWARWDEERCAHRYAPYP